MPPVGKIAQLPEDIREWLHATLVDRSFGDIVQVTEDLQGMLREAGLDVTVGKSAVGAESLKLKRAQEAIRASTEAAKLLASSSADPTDARGEAAMALVTTEMFEVLLQVREAADEMDPLDRLKALTKAGETVGTLSRARVNQAKWRGEVEERARVAAEAVTRIAKAGGLQGPQVDEIRSQILGITKRGG